MRRTALPTSLFAAVLALAAGAAFSQPATGPAPLSDAAKAKVAAPAPAPSVKAGEGGLTPPADSPDRQRALAAGYNEFGAGAYVGAAKSAERNGQPPPDVEKYRATAKLQEYLFNLDPSPLQHFGPGASALDDVRFTAQVTEKGGGSSQISGISAMGVMMQLFGGPLDSANVGSFIPAADGQMRGRIIVSLADGHIYDTGEIVVRPNVPTTVPVPGGGSMTVTASFKDYERMLTLYQTPGAFGRTVQAPPVH